MLWAAYGLDTVEFSYNVFAKLCKFSLLPVAGILADSVGVALGPVEAGGERVALVRAAEPQLRALARHVLRHEGRVARQVVLAHRVVLNSGQCFSK